MHPYVYLHRLYVGSSGEVLNLFQQEAYVVTQASSYNFLGYRSHIQEIYLLEIAGVNIGLRI